MDFTNFFEYISPRIATFLTAMTPIGELRASIPIALGTLGMNIFETYIISVIGNMVPVVAILWILEPVSKFLMRIQSWVGLRISFKRDSGTSIVSSAPLFHLIHKRCWICSLI